jgi:hypothetical protein
MARWQEAKPESYFQRGLEAYPEPHCHLADVLWGINSVVLYYTNQMGTGTAEFMELSASGKVVRVVANYRYRRRAGRARQSRPKVSASRSCGARK